MPKHFPIFECIVEFNYYPSPRTKPNYKLSYFLKCFLHQFDHEYIMNHPIYRKKMVRKCAKSTNDIEGYLKNIKITNVKKLQQYGHTNY